MAQSPAEVRRTAAPESQKYLGAWSAINQLMRDGHSWSGHERSCCFLNLGQQRFADVSAVTGWDWLDDGRAIGLTDWDHDGDLDAWLANRSAPMVRFLENQTERSDDHHFLVIQLRGTRCSRDAIGARVEVHRSGQPPLIRTVRCGEGYLSQSSRWVHLGLGSDARIERLVVRWPGQPAEVQEFSGVPADRHYLLTQGDEPRVWSRPSVEPSHDKPITKSDSPQAADDVLRVVPPRRNPVPPMWYRTFDGKAVPLTTLNDRPQWIVFWASWCAPCLEELAEWSRRAKSLKNENLRITAICLDGLGDGQPPPDVNVLQQRLRDIDFPFEQFSVGLGTPELAEMLDLAPDAFLDVDLPLSIPLSMLLDRDGRLAVLYLGRVSADRILADSALLTDATAMSRSALPFAGRWLDELSSRSPLKEPGGFPSRSQLASMIGLVGVVIVLAFVWRWSRKRIAAFDDGPATPTD